MKLDELLPVVFIALAVYLLSRLPRAPAPARRYYADTLPESRPVSYYSPADTSGLYL